MSHHLDSPLSRQDPRLNLTDSYLFRSDRGTVFVLDANTSLAGATPGFHPDARYEFKVHLDGSEVEGLTYRFAFSARDGDGNQGWTLSRLAGASARDDASVGDPILEGVTGTVATAASGVRAWAGRALDPFYLDLAQLGAIGTAVRSGAPIHYGEWAPAEAKNTFEGSNVFAIVLEIPFADELVSRGRSIATWATTKLATDAGGWHPINRAGLPMIWPIFRADDSEIADHSNLTSPEQDRANYLDSISAQIADTVFALGTSKNSTAYADLIAKRLLPDVLPYVVGSAASFGFAGFNGRELSDNAPEVMFSLVTNSAVSTGLHPGASTIATAFPFVSALAD
jgi:hypothetical protein